VDGEAMTVLEVEREVRKFLEAKRPGYVRYNYAEGGRLVSVEIVPAPFRVSQGEIVDTAPKVRVVS
jgi:hypothetical protein